jgi:hypothetical protein
VEIIIMADILGPIFCASVIVFALLAFFVWLCFIRVMNEIFELKQHVGAIPATVKESNQGLASGLAKQAKEKPPLPEDLDALTDILIKLLQAGWTKSADPNVGLAYFQMASYLAPYLRGQWDAIKQYDAEHDLLWVSLTQRQQQSPNGKQGGGKQQSGQNGQNGSGKHHKHQQSQGR